MTRKFRLLKPIGQIPAGTIGSQYGNLVTFNSNEQTFSLLLTDAETRAEWYKEIEDVPFPEVGKSEYQKGFNDAKNCILQGLEKDFLISKEVREFINEITS